MEDKNSLEYLQSLKEKSNSRYDCKPYKPRGPEATQSQRTETLYDALMELYLEASRRVMARGKRPLPYVPEAEDELNEAWRVCLLGWADIEYFKKALDNWERITGENDNGIRQETMKF